MVAIFIFRKQFIGAFKSMVFQFSTKKNAIYSHKLRVLAALAFLPGDEVRDAFQDLIDEGFFFEFPEQLNEIETAGMQKVSTNKLLTVICLFKFYFL